MTTWRLGIYAAVCFAILGLGAYAVHIKHKADRTEKAEAQTKALLDQIDYLQQVANNRENAIQALEAARAATPVRPVRLCPKTMPANPRDPKPPNGPTTPTGDGAEEPRPDLGPSLYSEADRNDELAEQLRELQDRVRSLAQKPN